MRKHPEAPTLRFGSTPAIYRSARFSDVNLTARKMFPDLSDCRPRRSHTKCRMPHFFGFSSATRRMFLDLSARALRRPARVKAPGARDAAHWNRRPGRCGNQRAVAGNAAPNRGTRSGKEVEMRPSMIILKATLLSASFALSLMLKRTPLHHRPQGP